MFALPVPNHTRTWVEVDRSALRRNLAYVRKKIGPGPGILSVVKANAYGHGVTEAVKTLAGDTEVFGVANIKEAIEVSDVDSGREILLLGPCLPAEREIAVHRKFIVTVSSAEEALCYSHHGKVSVNFKIDTGMGRVGCNAESALDDLRRLLEIDGVSLHSISTHLPSADEDSVFTQEQLNGFEALASEIKTLASEARFHVLNSAGILTQPRYAYDLVRPGLILYGISPLPEYSSEIEPALSWKSRITLLRDLPQGASVSYGRTYIAKKPIRVALVAVGYADGFPRHVSGRGACVLVRGVRCPLLGRVTMDQIVVDVSGVPDAVLGDEVTLIGTDGDERIDVCELARLADSIPWEILAVLGRRVEIYYR